MTTIRTYNFEYNESCEMCGDASAGHKILGQRLSQSQGFSPKNKAGISVSVRRCRRCRLIYSYPQPVPGRIEDHYGIKPEEYSWKKDYYNYDTTYFARQIATYKQLRPMESGAKALDIGAGLGKAMKSLDNAGFDAHGVEASPQFRDRAIEWLKIPASRIQLSAVETAEYPRNTFDFITFGAVFEHLYHPAAVLARAGEWLKPGGIIHIEVPSADHLLGKLINAYYALRGTNFVTHLSPMHPPFHLYEYTLESFNEVCRQVRLQSAQHYYDVCEIYHFPRIVHPFLRKYMERTNTGMQLTVYLRKPA